MSYNGVIFDFNGTLFWDTPLHNQAWDSFLEKHQLQLTDEEKNERIHGKNNRDILNGLFERILPADELAQYIDEKESLYRDICVKTGQGLAPGAIQLFEDLQERDVLSTIATASGPENVYFFFEHFQLNQWFDFSKTVFDDGSLRGKPQPDYFTSAMKKLQLAPEKCLVFEDSYAGIAAAENARAGKIVIVDSTDGNYHQYVHQTITHFDQIDREIFKN